jgi:hypothetical protein
LLPLRGRSRDKPRSYACRQKPIVLLSAIRYLFLAEGL